MFRFEFDATNQIFRVRFQGRVTDEELKTCYGRIGEQAAGMDLRAAVIDFSDVSSFEVSPTTIRKLADSPPALSNPSVPRCIVAPPVYIFGLSRIFELQGERTRPNLYVVRSSTEVWALLCISEPQFRPIAERS